MYLVWCGAPLIVSRARHPREPTRLSHERFRFPSQNPVVSKLLTYREALIARSPGGSLVYAAVRGGHEAG
jgi:hypothetical protein